MIEFFFDWGLDVDPKSSIKGYFQNECLVIEYHNTLTPYPAKVQTFEYEGNKIIVELLDGESPDIFSIEPAYGWVIEKGPNPSQVEEEDTATIVLCQVTLS